MSLEAINQRHVRRQLEPEDKKWHDDVLEMPWEEIQPALHRETIFALKNVFFFSHATSVQARTLAKTLHSGSSAVVEAPTGSGKTLAFLIPLMERTVRSCDAFAAAYRRPPLNRHILGVIFSPSRALAEQTYVVAKGLSARFSYNISFVLCDGVIHSAAAVAEHLCKKARGGGVFIITTPKDFAQLLPLLEEKKQIADRENDKQALLAEQDEETRRRYALLQERRKAARLEAGVPPSSSSAQDDDTVCFHFSEQQRFTVVVDEADYALNSAEMRSTIEGFLQSHCSDVTSPKKHAKAPQLESPKKKGRKRGRSSTSEHNDTTEGAPSDAGKLATDLFLVGATVATSTTVADFATAACAKLGSQLSFVTSQSQVDFFSQLQNKYVLCDAHNFLPYLVQLMNLHPSKKHFVFFNTPRALLFVQKLFAQLCQGSRPFLYIRDVYVMYEGMPEGARIDQYNRFLTHVTQTPAAKPEKKRKTPVPTDAEKKNQVYTSGWKRSGAPKMGSGTILLCTDIAAYGLDVRDVDYVYHFEPPSTVEAYVHRVGRVGRMGMRGCSVLLLPRIAAADDAAGLQQSRERKTTTTRFNTVSNTKMSTGSLQTVPVTLDELSEEKQRYVEELSERSTLEEYNIPPFAPITATLRNIIGENPQLLKLAKTASMAMCEPGKTEAASWFTPKLALRSLLLD